MIGHQGMSRTERPPPPIVGKVTDTSIQLYWNALPGHPKFCIQEFDTAKSSDWGNVYTGTGLDTTITSLEPQNAYRFRIRALFDDEASPWSAVVTVSTTRKAISGEDLHKAINAKDIAAVRDVLESGHVQINVPDKLGFSPLMNASQRGHARIVEELLKRGADVGFTNSSGKTSLMLAAFQGHVPVMELLIREHASIQQVDKGGQDALHAAVMGEHAEAVEYLLGVGCNVNGRDTVSGWTPLIRCAVVGGNAQVADVLIRAGADVNAKDNTEKTALMIAAMSGHDALVKLLVARGANASATTEHGGKAADFASTFGHATIADLLSS